MLDSCTCLALSDDTIFSLTFDGTRLDRGFLENLPQPEAKIVSGTPEARIVSRYSYDGLPEFFMQCELASIGWELVIPTKELLANPKVMNRPLMAVQERHYTPSSQQSELRSRSATTSLVLNDMRPRPSSRQRSSLFSYLNAFPSPLSTLHEPDSARELLDICKLSPAPELLSYLANIASSYRRELITKSAAIDSVLALLEITAKNHSQS